MTALLTALEPLLDIEPRSTMALAAALRDPSPRNVKVLTAGPRGRSRCVVVRDPSGYWAAHPFLAHESDAEQLAAAIDRSIAIMVDGHPDDITPVLPHLRRAGGSTSFKKVIAPWEPVAWPAPEPHVRMANAFDVPALVDLFEHYELVFGPTRAVIRRRLHDAVSRMWVVVSESEAGDVEGAMVLDGVTPRFMVWGHLSVHPDARNKGRSWAMVARVAALNQASGLGFMSVVAHTNPMATPALVPDQAWDEETMSVRLSLPDRVPGERRLRLAVRRLQKLRKTRVPRPGGRGTRDPDSGTTQSA